MRTILLALVLAPAVLAQTSRVPFVGCSSDGQAGPQEAPKEADKIVGTELKAAQRLAYYKGAFGSGVVGPRGWYCFGVYGSSGSSLVLTPQPIKHDLAGVDSGWNTGPGIEVDNIDGGTTGRYEVARVIARVFPTRKAFVQEVIEMFQGASDYKFGPYPRDKLIVQTDRLVEYETPPQAEGLGTTGRLQANAEAIHGVAMLEGQTPDLLMLRVRLPHELRDLTAPIIHQFERR